MKVFLDTESLTWALLPDPIRERLVALVAGEYPKDEVLFVRPDDRMRVLASLVEGAGVAVVTGPKMLPFWSAVSHEVQLWVQPDSYLSRRRTSDLIWALESEGLSPTEANKLSLKPPILDSNQYMPAYKRALTRVQDLRVARQVTEPVIEGQAPVEVMYGDEALEYVAGLQQVNTDDDNPICLDYEWNQLSYAPVGLSISRDSRWGNVPIQTNVYIPFKASDYTAAPGFATKILEAIYALHDAGAVTVYHGGKADLMFMAENTGRDPLTLYPSPIHDTMVMAYVAGFTQLGLKALTPEVLGRQAMGYPGELEELPVALAARYAAAGDTRNTLDLYRMLRAKLRQQDQWNVYAQIEMPIVPLVASMEWLGQSLSVAELYRAKTELENTMRGLEQHVWAKHRFDLSKDKDQRAWATKMLGYDPGTLSNEILSQKSEEAWMDTLIGYRKLRHRYRAFVLRHIRRWKRQGYPSDFRAYSSFNQAGSPDERDPREFTRAPKTGRFSSSAQKRAVEGHLEEVGDNLQNQPEVMRAAYIAPPGCEVFSYDYSGLEYRIGAGVTQDPAMLAIIREVCPSPGLDGCEHEPKHGDPHGQFQHKAWQLTGVNPGRTVAKNWNFGANYGAGPDTQRKTLAKVRAFITEAQAIELDKAHHEVYYTYHQFQVDEQQRSVKRGYGLTMMGRRRYDGDLSSSDNELQRHAMRSAGSMAIQGTAADILKIVMGELIPILLKYGARITIQVHDEIVGWVPSAVKQEFDLEVRALMQSKSVNGVPLLVSGGIGKSWAVAH